MRDRWSRSRHRDRIVLRGVGAGKAKGERGTAGGAVLEIERAAHALGQLAANRQPQPEPGLARGVAAAVEALKDRLALVRMHARSLVTDADGDDRLTLEDHANLGSGWAGAHRVVEQDAQDLG